MVSLFLKSCGFWEDEAGFFMFKDKFKNQIQKNHLSELLNLLNIWIHSYTLRVILDVSLYTVNIENKTYILYI